MKNIAIKLILQKFIEKAKLWLTQTGFSNVIYLAIALGLLFGFIPIGLVGLGFLKPYLIGGSFSIFCYINWNTIVKLWKTEILKKVEGKI